MAELIYTYAFDFGVPLRGPGAPLGMPAAGIFRNGFGKFVYAKHNPVIPLMQSNMEVHHLHLLAIHDALVQPLESPSQELKIDCNHLFQLIPAARVLP